MHHRLRTFHQIERETFCRLTAKRNERSVESCSSDSVRERHKMSHPRTTRITPLTSARAANQIKRRTAEMEALQRDIFKQRD